MYQRLILSIAFSISVVLLFAQQYNFQYFSVKEGLAQSQVYAMIEDQGGYIWLGTHGGGVNRFDGKEFETFTVKDGLINNTIDEIYESSGSIYFAAKNGMSIYNGRYFENHFVSKEENIPITAFQYYQEKMLIGTGKGVYEFDGTNFKNSVKYNLIKGIATTCFFTDSKSRLWIGTKRGVQVIDPVAADKKYTGRDGFTNGWVTGISEDSLGQIWLSTLNGVYKYNDSVFHQFTEEEGLASNFLNTVNCLKDGSVWVGTQNKGITILNPGDSSVIQLDDSQGLCNNNVFEIIQDSWGGVWIGTSGGGICKYVGQQFEHFPIFDGPGENLVYSMVQDTAGHMWYAAADDGIVKRDSSGFTRYNSVNGFVNSKTKAMLCDSKGRLWFGTNDKGLAYFSGQSFEFLKYNNQFLGLNTKDIIEDENGQIWIANNNGVFKVAPGDSTITTFEIKKDTLLLPDSIVVNTDTLIRDSVIFKYEIEKVSALNFRINDLYFDRLDRLWFAGVSRGLGYYFEDEVVFINQTVTIPGNEIRSIIEDEAGHLWAGTDGYGIARINLYADSLDLQIFNENDGLTSGNIYLLNFDKAGDLWVGCGKGVNRLNLDEDFNIKSTKSYGISDGFLGGETCQNATMIDADGNLWFGTIDGATKYIPGTNVVNRISPKLSITAVDLFFEPFQLSPFADWIGTDNVFKKGIELPYKQNHLSFEFKGLNLLNPQKVTYQWKLEGEDQDWTPRSKKNSITYSSIPPGEYTFKVRAFNEDLVASEPLKTSFTIKTPIWQQAWFIISGSLFLAGLIGLLFWWRLRQVREKARIEQERLSLENNLLQLEQKALQLQMNPHFIFNALNTVQSLFMSNEQVTARQLINKFAKLMRSILENSREEKISLQKEIELLNNYLSIEQFSRPNKFNFEIKVADELDPEEVNLPPMMIQPFVENAIIHGVSHLKSGGLIQLYFEKKNDHLICTIRDNGIGREAAAKINEMNARKHKSVAMEVTRERLDFLNELNDGKSLVINDIIDEDGSVKGTGVVIKLPFEAW